MRGNGFGDYYLGLDIGTNSVGWAVTDENYNILKANNKYLHGVRMFEAMETAESRRLHRSTRRRYKRRKDRLDQLREYFRAEIERVDPEFFTRLDEGFLQEPERTVERKYTFFDDDNYTDVDYHKEYPTIYHLRQELSSGKEPKDIRLVYLALHHIMKYRGHFLFFGVLDLQGNIHGLLEELNSHMENFFDKPVYSLEDQVSKKEFLEILVDKSLNKRRRAGELRKFQDQSIDKKENKEYEEIHKLLSARKVNLEKLFTNSEFDEEVSIQFDDANIDEKMDQLSQLNDEEFRLIEIAKSIYDWSLLQNILGDATSISDAMIKSYEKHKEELEELKGIVRDIGPKEYKEFFVSGPGDNKPSYYQAYIESTDKGQDKLYSEIRKVLKKSPKKFEKEANEILDKISNGDYLLKQRISTNGVIPHQLHFNELSAILDNASRKYGFLKEIDQTGLSKKKQIKDIFKFRIPYYVGPLNDAHKEDGFAWVVRKESGKVYPWNFGDKIDENRTAEAFIKRMTNKCTYLLEEDVLPKSSLLYQKYMVLNAINNIKLNDVAINPEIKQRIYEDLFVKQSGRVSKRKIENWVRANLPEFFDGDLKIDGIDITINASLSSLHTLKSIFGDNIPSEKDCEELIYWSTIFNEEKHILKERIEEAYPSRYSEEELKRFTRANFVGWGRFSSKLLEELNDSSFDGESMSIIQAMYHTNKNFMELMSKEFSYSKQIEEHNQEILSSASKTVTYGMLDSLNMAPNIKRPVWQTIRITEEIKKITKREPTRIFIEMAREHGPKRRTTSRKQQLEGFYKSMSVDPLLKENLSNESDQRLRQRKVFLYYKQLGRCAYTGEIINFSRLLQGLDYDLDHIYPRSKTDDDSLINLVLVNRQANEAKSDSYPISREVQQKNRALWYQLKESGLMEKEKYYRLTRTHPLTADELANFVARQLVETRQSTKAVMGLLQQIYPSSKVITIKAKHVDKFRHDNDFIKVRSINDFHHAKDAYLSIVVGNAYFSKFTDSPRIYIKNAGFREYNLAKIIDSKEPGKVICDSNGLIAWESGVKGTIKTVKDMMANNQILTTYMIQERSGGLFDQTIVPASKNKISLKDGLPADRYGGYNKPTYAYFVLVEESKKKNPKRLLLPIPKYIDNQFASKEDKENYIEEALKVKGKIILDRIPSSNMLFEIEGARARITGVNGETYVLRNEHQPHFNKNVTETLKVVDKIKSNNRVDLYEKLEASELISVYDAILDKMSLKIYVEKCFKFHRNAEDNRDIFISAEVEQKVNLVWDMLKLIKSTRETADLRLIKGAKQAGVYTLGRNISNKNSVNLIHQSVTGVYEQKVDLLRI